VHRDKFIIIKPTRCTNLSNLLGWNSTCFGQFLCPSSGVFHTVHTAVVCVIQVCWQLASRIRMFHPYPACNLSANLYDIYHCCVYIENSWWWTEKLSETCRISFEE